MATDASASALGFLLAIQLVAQTQGLELTMTQDISLVGKVRNRCGQLTCRTQANAEVIDSVKLTRTKISGVTDALLALTRETPNAVVSLDSLAGNGTVVDNLARFYVDQVKLAGCSSDVFTCEVTFTKSSGETGRAFSMAGPGTAPSVQRDVMGQDNGRTREPVPKSPASGLSNPYVSEIWFLGEKITKVEGKFSTLADRLDRRITESVSDIYKRASSVENSVLGRVASVETDFSGRISRLEDRLASRLLSQPPEEDPDSHNASADLERRLEDITLTLEKLNASNSPAATHKESDGHQDNQPATCFPGMGDDVTQAYQPYIIMTHDTLKREILCDTKTSGGGWIVIQRRTKGNVSFYRDWTDYRNGFGPPSGDFWLGNEAVHELTDKHPYELRVDMRIKGQELFAQYTSFRIEAESDNYRLRLGSYFGSVGEKNTGEGLSYHNNYPFSTFDRDNDGSSSHCAVTYHGAWWYKGCLQSNLNGMWKVKEDKGVMWDTGLADLFPTLTEMKIRRI